MTDLTTKQVIDALDIKSFSVFGPPMALVSDNQLSLKNNNLTSFCKRRNVKQSFISIANASTIKLEGIIEI